jgi:hypothetical protein
VPSMAPLSPPSPPWPRSTGWARCGRVCPIGACSGIRVWPAQHIGAPRDPFAQQRWSATTHRRRARTERIRGTGSPIPMCGCIYRAGHGHLVLIGIGVAGRAPFIDVNLNRLDCCFLPSPSGDGSEMSARLAIMAGELGPREALPLFPEGANWTPRRRLRAISRLRRDDKLESARAASLMANVLPPRPGGVLACLDARPTCAWSSSLMPDWTRSSTLVKPGISSRSRHR